MLLHPQADTIEGIFARAVLSQGSRQEKAEEGGKNAEVGTKLGTAVEATKRLLPPSQSK
jgi:hypothetical protein